MRSLLSVEKNVISLSISVAVLHHSEALLVEVARPSRYVAHHPEQRCSTVRIPNGVVAVTLKLQKLMVLFGRALFLLKSLVDSFSIGVGDSSSSGGLFNSEALLMHEFAELLSL